MREVKRVSSMDERVEGGGGPGLAELSKTRRGRARLSGVLTGLSVGGGLKEISGGVNRTPTQPPPLRLQDSQPARHCVTTTPQTPLTTTLPTDHYHLPLPSLT